MIRAEDEGVPSPDVLRLLQPDVYFVVLKTVRDSYKSKSAVEGDQMVPSRHMAKVLRTKLKATRGTASVMQNVVAALHRATFARRSSVADAVADVVANVCPSVQFARRQRLQNVVADSSVASATFARTVFAHQWQRWYISLGMQLRAKLVSV